MNTQDKKSMALNLQTAIMRRQDHLRKWGSTPINELITIKKSEIRKETTWLKRRKKQYQNSSEN